MYRPKLGWKWALRQLTSRTATPGVKINIESPTSVVENSAFELRGWAAHPSGAPSLQVTINERPVDVFTYARPDVAAAFPDCRTTGFSAFVRLAELPRASDLTIRASCHGEGELHRRFTVGRKAIDQIEREELYRSSKRQWLLAHLRCIRCNSDLSDDAGTCSSCGRTHWTGSRFNCLPDTVPVPSDMEFNGAICSHGYDQDVERIVSRVEQTGGKVLDCGAGWRSNVRESVVTTEIFPYPSTDVLAVNEKLPFKDGVFDAVLSLHVLEHVPDPFRSASELQRVLRPGGALFAVTPMIVPEHGFPHHFFNPTREGLARLFGAPPNARVFVPAMGHAINGVRTVLDLYQGELPAKERRKFLSMTVADIVERPVEEWIGEDIAKTLSESGRMRLAANYCIEFTKPE